MEAERPYGCAQEHGQARWGLRARPGTVSVPRSRRREVVGRGEGREGGRRGRRAEGEKLSKENLLVSQGLSGSRAGESLGGKGDLMLSLSLLSWAFAEELDSLIGEKREKLGSPLLGCPAPGLASSGPIRPLAPPVGLSQPLHSIHPAPGPIPGKNPLQDLLGGHVPSCYGQTYSHLSPGLAPPGPPQPLFPQPDGHLELRAQPGTPQDSPLPANTPPSHSAKLLAEPSPARTMHDTLLPDGDLGTDLDAINPSLTDFDFQGEPGVGKGRWPIPFKSPGCGLLAARFLVS